MVNSFLRAALPCHGGTVCLASSPPVLPSHSRLLFDIANDLPNHFHKTGLVEELRSLSTETNSEMLLEALVLIGLREADRGHSELASRILAAVSRESSLPRSGDTQAVNIARKELDTLLGHGNLGDKSEALLRRLIQDALNPVGIAGMLAGSLAFNAARLKTLSSLMNSKADFFTRGLPAKLISGSAAFAVEVPVFTMTEHGLRRALGQRDGTNGPPLLQGLFDTAFTLGFLKVGQNGAHFLSRRLCGPGLRARARFNEIKNAIGQLGVLAGAYAGKSLEKRFGHGSAADGTSELLDSISILFSVHISNRLLTSLLGQTRLHIPSHDWQDPRSSKRGLASSNSLGQGLFAYAGNPRTIELWKGHLLMEGVPKGDAVRPGASDRLKSLFNLAAEESGLASRWSELSKKPSEAAPGEIERILAIIENRRLARVREYYSSTDRLVFLPDLTKLNPAEQRAVEVFSLEIAPLVDEIYSLQEGHGNLELSRWLKLNGDPLSRTIFHRRRRDFLETKDPFLSLFPFFPGKHGLHGMISSNITLGEIEQLKRKTAPSSPLLRGDTVLFKNSLGEIVSQPMVLAEPFRGLFSRLSLRLAEIAATTVQGSSLSTGLQKQLNAWAKYFSSGQYDDFKAALQSTVDQRDGLLRVNIGPLVPYGEDGIKRAMLLQVGVIDSKLRADLEEWLLPLLDLEKSIAVPNYSPRGISVFPGTVNPIHQAVIAGHIRSYPAREVSGFSLSGEEFPGIRGDLNFIHLETHGEIARRNQVSLRKILEEDLSGWDNARGVREFVASHEFGHLIGPQSSHVTPGGKTVADSFGRHYGSFEEAKADLGAVLQNLQAKYPKNEGSFPQKDFLRSYMSYLLSFRYKGKNALSGIQGHDFARLFQVGFYFSREALTFSNKLTIHYDKIPPAARELWLKILEYQSQGDVNGAIGFASQMVDAIPDGADRLILNTSKEMKPFLIERNLK